MIGSRPLGGGFAAVLALALVASAAALPVVAGGDTVVAGGERAPAERSADRPTPAASEAVDALHGNHVTVPRQVVAEGEVVVDQLYIYRDGFVAVYAGRGEDARLLGSREVAAGFHANLAIDTNRSFWAAASGAQTVTVKLHVDDGDGEFDPATDRVPPAGAGGYPTTETTARPGERAAVVVPYAGNATHRTDGRELTIRRVDLPADGYLVLRGTTDRGTPGEVVAGTPLSAGRHENVTLSLGADFFGDARSSVVLYAEVRTGGENPEAATPIEVGGDPVATRFSVRKGTSEADGGIGVSTATPTRTVAPTSAGDDTGGDAGPTPGFGVGSAAVALLAVLLGVARLGREA